MEFTNPSVARKTHRLHTYTAITASENSAAFVLPRGARNVKFSKVDTLNDRTTANETYDAKIQTRRTSADSWEDVAGCAFAQVAATTGSEQVPSATNAPGVVLKNQVRVALTLAGNTPISTGYVDVSYDAPYGPGKQVSHGAIS